MGQILRTVVVLMLISRADRVKQNWLRFWHDSSLPVVNNKNKLFTEAPGFSV